MDQRSIMEDALASKVVRYYKEDDGNSGPRAVIVRGPRQVYR